MISIKKPLNPLKSKYKYIKTATILAIVVLVILYVIGVLFVHYAINRRDESFTEYFNKKEATMDPKDVEALNDQWYVEGEQERRDEADIAIANLRDNSTNSSIYITASDNATLYAMEYLNENSNLWVLILHGYGAYGTEVTDIGVEFYNAGYNVLIPDMRGNSLSGGDYITFGIEDKEDIATWADYIVSEDSNAKIVLHGSSMGASSVLMALGSEYLPSNVMVAISDSAYTSVNDVIAAQLDLRLNLGEFPLVMTTNFVTQLHTGINLDDANPISYLDSFSTPTLFIHSMADEVIPPYMVDELYNQYQGEKSLIKIPEANHISGRFADPDTYYREMFDFIDKYM